MIGGKSHDIKLYNSENYECIGNFSNPNNGHILRIQEIRIEGKT